MERTNSAHIEQNLDSLTKLTRNFPDVLERLRDYDVLTASEINHIECCSDEETSLNMLYRMVAQKPISNFDLLLYVLQDTDNDLLAKMLRNSLNSGHSNFARPPRSGENSQTEPGKREDSNQTLIVGGEMGISEILQEYEQNWTTLFRVLRLPRSCLNSYKYDGNFIIQVTLMLRDWSTLLRRKATVGNICKVLEEAGYQACSVRVRRMFNRYIDSGFAFDFPGSFSIKGKISAITEILDNNPSFCIHPENLLLLLSLPLESLPEFLRGGPSFLKIAPKMLIRWSEMENSSTDHLAALLAINGHFCTCAKIASL